MRCLLLLGLLLGCQAPQAHFDESDIEWPAWVARAYARIDDAGVIIEESETDLVTQHEWKGMACGGSYECRVGWRKTDCSQLPLWIECEVETAPSVWGCIHAKQPRLLFRFVLRPMGRRWKAEDPIPQTPWLDSVLEAIRGEKDWRTFQICWGNLNSDRYEATILGWFEGNEDWSNREVVAVLGADGAWRATWVPKNP